MLTAVSCVPSPLGYRVSFPENTVAVIKVEGTIQSGSGGLLSGAYSDDIVKLLERARKDSSVKAVVLRVNSPGGEVTACDEIYNEVVKVRESGKKVVSSMGSMAASGGYYISCACDKIVAEETTLTGSIGVIATFPNIEGLLDKIGVKVYVFKSGPHKDASAGLREPTEEEKQVWQSIVDESFNRFVGIVAEGRNMDEEKVRELADGRIYTATQAKENGLIDKFGDLDEATNLAASLAGIGDEFHVEELHSGGVLGSLFGFSLRSLNPASTEEFIGIKRQPSLQYIYVGL